MTNDSTKTTDPRILEIALKVTSKRPRTVIDHIIEHGFITTEELEKLYGYKHPPRAIRDVREQGIPLATYRVKASDGRSIAAYRFDDFSKVKHNRLGGREVFSKEFKAQLVNANGSRCSICAAKYHERYLQIDHRIPYEVTGDTPISAQSRIGDFMLICATCNRKKSWSCEHCANWIQHSKPEICASCYWSSPENYKHIAQQNVRRVEIVFNEACLDVYEKLSSEAERENLSVSENILRYLNKSFPK